MVSHRDLHYLWDRAAQLNLTVSGISPFFQGLQEVTQFTFSPLVAYFLFFSGCSSPLIAQALQDCYTSQVQRIKLNKYPLFSAWQTWEGPPHQKHQDLP